MDSCSRPNEIAYLRKPGNPQTSTDVQPALSLLFTPSRSVLCSAAWLIVPDWSLRRALFHLSAPSTSYWGIWDMFSYPTAVTTTSALGIYFTFAALKFAYLSFYSGALRSPQRMDSEFSVDVYWEFSVFKALEDRCIVPHPPYLDTWPIPQGRVSICLKHWWKKKKYCPNSPMELWKVLWDFPKSSWEIIFPYCQFKQDSVSNVFGYWSS